MSKEAPQEDTDLANPDLKPDDLVIKSSAPKYIPISTIIKTFTEHPTLSIRQAAKLLNISHQALYERLQRAEYTPERMREFAKYRKATYEYLELLLVNALTPEKINKLDTKSLVWSLAVIGDKRRLEEGKSTANIKALHEHIVLEGSKTDAVMAAIKAEMGRRGLEPGKQQPVDLKELPAIDVQAIESTSHPTGEAQGHGRAEVIPEAGESTEEGTTGPPEDAETLEDERGQGAKGG